MLMSDKNFSACHAVVPPQAYYDACIHETCLCNKGGDCACYCAAIATYVRACNQHGISITWRREGFCGKCWIEWHLKIILLYNVSIQSTRLVRKQRKIIKLLKYIFSLCYIQNLNEVLTLVPRENWDLSFFIVFLQNPTVHVVILNTP